MLLALVRHGATDWNEAGLIQGRTDRPLAPRGRARVARWRLPAALAGFELVSSPLCRARETAALLRGRPATPEPALVEPILVEPALVEMAWGEWEGRKLADLRATLGARFTDNEARGLDFRPTGGESPREVQDRLKPWLAARAEAGQSTLAVTHKGIIRAVLGLATGWSFQGKPPARLDRNCAHLFRLSPDGQPSLVEANIALEVA